MAKEWDEKKILIFIETVDTNKQIKILNFETKIFLSKKKFIFSTYSPLGSAALCRHIWNRQKISF